MKRILFLSTVDLGNRDNGKAVVINGIDSFLNDAENEGLIKYFFCGPKNDHSRNNSPLNLLIPSIWEKLFNLFIYTFILRSKSIQESLFYSNAFKKRLLALSCELDINVIVYDTIRLGQYIPTKKREDQIDLLYLEDLFSVRYQRLLAALDSPFARHINTIGNFGKNMPRFVESLISRSSLMQRILITFERKLVFRAEVQQTAIAYKSLLLNADEVEIISSLNKSSVEVIPPHLGLNNTMLRQWTGEKNILFIGGLGLPHNSVGLLEFIIGPFQKLISKYPDLVLWIIGKGLTASLSEAVDKNHKNIRYCGYIPDLSDLMNKSACMIAPLLFGSGVKLKAVEAFSAGIPLVSTKYGVEGTKFADNNHGFLRDNLNDFPDAIEETFILDKNDFFSMNARDLFLAEYSELAVRRRYREIFEID